MELSPLKLLLPKQNWLSQIITAPVKKGAKGEGIKNSACKITEDQVLEIRRMNRDGVSQYKIAEKYGMSQPAVNHIVTRYTWKHLD